MLIRYSGVGRQGWAGIYWLSPANNWAKIKGAGYDLTKANRLTFWARGAKGGDRREADARAAGARAARRGEGGGRAAFGARVYV